jgi:hypothetical protein
MIETLIIIFFAIFSAVIIQGLWYYFKTYRPFYVNLKKQKEKKND